MMKMCFFCEKALDKVLGKIYNYSTKLRKEIF